MNSSAIVIVGGQTIERSEDSERHSVIFMRFIFDFHCLKYRKENYDELMTGVTCAEIGRKESVAKVHCEGIF